MIRLIDIQKSYDNGTKALKGVNLRIDDGEFVFLVGPSGSGKSTILKLITAEIAPTGGRLMVNGYNLNNIRPRQVPYMRRTLGVIFQDFRLIPSMTVYENVAFVLRVIDAPTKYIRKRVPYVIGLVGLQDKTNAYPDELSGGEKRRAALAGIIAMKPKYLVLDEPMAGLDPLGRKAILDTIDNLRASLGCAVLMVSHSMDDMADRAERVAVMNGGKLIMEGKTRDVFAQSELLTSIGLDVPQVSKLGMELRKRGIDIPENIYEIEEMELALLKLLSKGGRA